MAQTAEQRKIARLERQIDALKDERRELKQQCEQLSFSVQNERQWRMDFQRLIKAAAFEDNLENYDRTYF